MAKHLTLSQLKRALRQPDEIADDPFRFLSVLCRTVSEHPQSESTIELVLRSLEHQSYFTGCQQVIDELARAVGLYPYADPESLDTRGLLAYEYHRPLDMPPALVFHRVQAEVYRYLLNGDNVILSAPTSFGKSLLIDAVIATGKHSNVAVIVPTLALIDETRRRLARGFPQYKVVTHPSQKLAANNLLVLTQERLLAFKTLPPIGFFVIDEFYKLDMEGEQSRGIALNQAFYRLWKGGGQFYLLGPNIDKLPDGLDIDLNFRFIRTNYATVVSEQIMAGKGSKDYEALLGIAKTLDEPTLIYCSSPARVNEIAELFIQEGVVVPTTTTASAARWAGDHYHPEWVFGQALRNGIGIHHGKLPRSLAQYVVRKFNDEKLRFLICTSTLIEGVNTKAKNVIIFDNKLFRRKLDYFTFNNIVGRSGRMFEHFVGRVYLFHDPPSKEIQSVDFPVFTQGEGVPDSLLVQLDDDDLHDDVKDRISSLSDQSFLTIEIIRENTSIDPTSQIDLAKHIAQTPRRHWRLLSWNNFPKYEELEHACILIWDYLVPNPKHKGGVGSGRQLAFKLMRLSSVKNARRLVAEEISSAQKPITVNEAVENVLDFERTWATFEFPRYIMALSRIQAFVFEEAGLEPGDYSFYAGQVESLFRPSVLSALDEYGVPLQVAEKIESELGDADDLDAALARLKRLNLSQLRLTAFESEVIADARESI